MIAMASVVQIFITDNPGQPMQSVQSVEAVASRGLRGDRKFRDPSHPKRDTPDREVTLIETEAIDAAKRDCAIQLEPIETRRNILTVGVALNHLVGHEFTVGQVRLRGLELCEPCTHLEGLTRKGVMRSLIHRGGLRAQVLEGGTIRVGDPIAPVA
jgi:MOSC domain-containing protein YiiM